MVLVGVAPFAGVLYEVYINSRCVTFKGDAAFTSVEAQRRRGAGAPFARIAMHIIRNVEYRGYHKRHTPTQRRTNADEIQRVYPEAVPVIVVMENNGHYPRADAPTTAYEMAVPRSSTMANIVATMRRHVSLKPTECTYALLENRNIALVPPTSVGDVYAQHGESDGYLYIRIVCENCFGSGRPPASDVGGAVF